ncbi:hypothetical protein K6L44_06970 [Gluconacetobacter entanii]|uniref:hypothetical protein n=1 Tax=Gluconacetobacter entanii TaxID=108528 RepID=UPI001C93367E|nr:hypothetical protein [Gluconacetobacter entanii]MBY4639741.1 hypothetical protein [Gluconacetobacter entanii]MCW4580376.1 hypothetical protein [Gluconacetobacter entanii]MCW4583705.1 hypothetical protein [Gluconacetobacter entanii]MCW4587015.1 hypothetical protein [Gluconacetobacter entanii]
METDQLDGGMGEAVAEAEIGLRALRHDGPEDSGKAVPAAFIQSYHLDQAFRRTVDLIKIVALALHPVTDGFVRLHPIGGVVLSGMSWRSRIFLS